jgi:hypothetical protein
MTLTFPVRGIAEIRRFWAGRGDVWAAIATAGIDDGVNWTPDLARRRAARVVVEMLRPPLAGWPESTRKWLEALPAQSVRRRVVDGAPGAGVDWVATRRHGWPPKEFHHRRRSRVADTLLVTATRWTIEALTEVVAASDGIDATALGTEARERHDTAVGLLELEPLASARPIPPSGSDLTALRNSGRPWAAASWLRVLDHDPARLAAMSIDPDPVLADRLFHVAVFGVVLGVLREDGWTLRPTSLAGAPDGRPAFRASDNHGGGWDLWFEAGAAWTYNGATAPYAAAVSGVAGTGGTLSADIALIADDGRALILECKFSGNPTYVGRNGYEQVLAYMVEVRTGLATSVSGIVVGPPEVVAATGSTRTNVGTVQVTNPDLLRSAILWAIEDATAPLI